MGQKPAKFVSALPPAAPPLGRLRRPSSARAPIDSSDFKDTEDVRLIRKIRGDLLAAIERSDATTAHANLRLMNLLYREMIAKKTGESEQQKLHADSDCQRSSPGESSEGNIPRNPGASSGADFGASGGPGPAEPSESAPAP